MKIAVLVNNYNYARFLDECIGSVLAQSRPADRIVVVDDGSTDGSVAELARIAARDPRVEVIAKTNGGQLSAFNAGVTAASDVDVLCFLDSDDRFESDYLRQVESAFRAHPEAELLYSGYVREFADGRRARAVAPAAEAPLQLLQTLVLHRFCGGPTSTIAVRREALPELLPYDDEASWRVSADDVLVMRAAAAGLRRRQLGEALVVYRVHASNNFYGRRRNRAARRQRRESRERMLAPWSGPLAELDERALRELFARELAANPRTATTAYRFALLPWRLRVRASLRPALLGDYMLWLLGRR